MQRRYLVSVAIAATALAAAAPAASADPVIERYPALSGDAFVGSSLQAGGASWKPDDRTPSWRWQRCTTNALAHDALESGVCEWVSGWASGGTGTSRTVIAADVDHYLRAALRVQDGGRTVIGFTEPSAKVALTPPPQPTPTATPTPPPTPSPSPDPVPVAQPAPETAVTAVNPIAAPLPQGAVLDATAVSRTPRMMRPAPLVRVRGRTTPMGARITLLTVSAPRGARITVRCKGRGCGVRRWARTTALTRLTRFERELGTGTRLTILVTKGNRIGKYTHLVIRRNRAPARVDRCLMPGSSRPVACPAAS